MNVLRRLLATQPLDRVRSDADGPNLRRVLGLPGLVAVGLGTMLGGIFTTIGAGAQTAGPAVIASFLLSGLACAFVAVCYAELAGMVPVAGSAYTYAYAVFGEFIAWVIGWDLILEYGISVAPTAASWSGYMQGALAGMGLNLPDWGKTANLVFDHGHLDVAHSQIDLLAIGVTLAITAILAKGIKESATTNTWLVVLQIGTMIAFIAGLAVAIHPQNFHPFVPKGNASIVQAAALVFFAYIGFDTVTVASEEARNPRRDVPLGIMISLAIGMVLYVGIAVVTVGIVPWHGINVDAGMIDAVKLGGNSGLMLGVVAVGAIAGNTTVMITSLLGQIRIFYCMSRDRLLPEAAAHIDPRTLTPLRTTLTTGVIVAALAGVVPLVDLLKLVNIGTLSAFAIVCAGVFVLRIVKPRADRPYRAPFGPVVALIGLGLCLYLMIGGIEGLTWLRFAIWFGVGAVIYALYGYRRSSLRALEAGPGSA